MSARCRHEAAKLRQRYARRFGLDVELVLIEYRDEDDAEVFAPSRPELPRWSMGSMEKRRAPPA